MGFNMSGEWICLLETIWFHYGLPKWTGRSCYTAPFKHLGLVEELSSGLVDC